MITRNTNRRENARQTNLDCFVRILDIVESLCYPLPEHPHRQHVFSLTTRTGDTYCFQVGKQ
jgi:hypothetical protein